MFTSEKRLKRWNVWRRQRYRNPQDVVAFDVVPIYLYKRLRDNLFGKSPKMISRRNFGTRLNLGTSKNTRQQKIILVDQNWVNVYQIPRL